MSARDDIQRLVAEVVMAIDGLIEARVEGLGDVDLAAEFLERKIRSAILDLWGRPTRSGRDGAPTEQRGKPMTGSRLIWELKKLTGSLNHARRVEVDADTLEQIEQWHEEGWLVRLTWMPEGRPFIAQGSASEYNPQPDTKIKGTEGYIGIELHWIKHDEECPAGYRWPHGMGPTVEKAVERCQEYMRKGDE